jgi:hypothetical protein
MAIEEEVVFALAGKDESAPLAVSLMERHLKGNVPLTEEKQRVGDMNVVVEYSDRSQGKQRKCFSSLKMEMR